MTCAAFALGADAFSTDPLRHRLKNAWARCTQSTLIKGNTMLKANRRRRAARRILYIGLICLSLPLLWAALHMGRAVAVGVSHAPLPAAPAIPRIPEWARGSVIRRVTVSPTVRAVALTFDDGPSEYTPQILEVLKRYSVRATFFMVGREIHAHPEITRQVQQGGHAIGNHSWSHPQRTRTPIKQITHTSALVYQELGISCELFRPPYGLMRNGLVRVALDREYGIVLWSVDPRDWERPGTDEIASRVLDTVEPGDIILLHDGGGNRSQTVAALSIILDALHSRDFTCVTVPELLQLRSDNLTAAEVATDNEHRASDQQ